MQTKMQSNIIDISLDNFQAVILEGSNTQPVMVTFWAPSHEESVALVATLEKLAQEFAGQFVLAKINCEVDQAIAMQFGVQALPTTAMFVNGQPCDGFAGNQEEGEIRAILQKHLPDEAELLLQQAQGQLELQTFEAAITTIKQVLALKPELAKAQIMLAKAHIELGHIAEAQALTEAIKLIDQDDLYHHVIAQIELAKAAADTPEIRALEAQIAANPSPLLSFELAIQYSQVNRLEEALELLYQVLHQDMNSLDGKVKQAFMDMLTTHSSDPAASAYRRKLYSLLY
ncbi:tetratricopeptide repeat protein [Motilimonas eburnea]|uniref:tetratricopeptide repeat protein n=1 Tax=Motilimonas eburnea TaxID=1737488 RepID=UPI001E3A1C8B|nr:tetratricopeptide repeat protein [Motilimonas eburnea]MCE2570165.1 tetratricopeptide repeat protein [Motilimonas eburnea]